MGPFKKTNPDLVRRYFIERVIARREKVYCNSRTPTIRSASFSFIERRNSLVRAQCGVMEKESGIRAFFFVP